MVLKMLHGPKFASCRSVRQGFQQRCTYLNLGVLRQIKFGASTKWVDKECVWEVDKALFHRKKFYSSTSRAFWHLNAALWDYLYLCYSSIAPGKDSTYLSSSRLLSGPHFLNLYSQKPEGLRFHCWIDHHQGENQFPLTRDSVSRSMVYLDGVLSFKT